MLEAAVDDGSQDFRLEEEVPESGAVNGDVGALHVALRGSVGRGRNGGGRLLVLVVEKLVVGDVGHGQS